MQARMKLDGRVQVLDIRRKIDSLLRDVGLTSRRDVRIGSSDTDDKVLSGGEKKRLSFATEVWYNHPLCIIFYLLASLSNFLEYYLFFGRSLVLHTFSCFFSFPLYRGRLSSFPTTQRTNRYYLVVNRSENIVPGRTNDRARFAFGKLFDISTEIVRSERTNSVVHHPST